MNSCSPTRPDGQSAKEMATQLGRELEQFVAPLLAQLDARLDKRLVRTFVGLMQAIIKWRNRPLGLILSELGAYLLSPTQAPASTKRISNLLRSPRWAHTLIEEFLWQKADEEVAALEVEGETPLVVWDESAWEKPESIKAEGLCAVRSRKAARLKRIRPGFYRPPAGGAVFVPGLHWLMVLVTGLRWPPQVAAMRWWTTRGLLASDRRREEEGLLRQCRQRWGGRVVHVFDRGFAGAPWLERLVQVGGGLRFIMRWPKGFKLLDACGQWQLPGTLVKHKRSWEQRLVWDAHRREWRKTGVVAIPISHPAYPGPLWLVVARQKGRPSPWYLLTNEPATTPQQAWAIVLAYARRWQVEMALRYNKSELAFESPRLWFWANRMKLLMIVTLVYAFLLHLLIPTLESVRDWLLRHWCHRTGNKVRKAHLPLYRLRSALSRLWLEYPPPPISLQNSG